MFQYIEGKNIIKQHIQYNPILVKIKNVKINIENNLEKDINWLTEEEQKTTTGKLTNAFLYNKIHLLFF